MEYPLRRVVVPITGRVFQWILTQGETLMARCVSGLPEGARFIGLQYEACGDVWLLVFEHESFAPVPEAEMLPRLMISYVSIIPPSVLTSVPADSPELAAAEADSSTRRAAEHHRK